MSEAPAPADLIVVLVTTPNVETAARIGQQVVEERLAACVNVIPQIRSIYRWQGKVQDDLEALCLCKTRPELFERLRDRIASLHPYEVPEVVALPVAQVNAAYLAWIATSTVSD